MLFRRYEMKSCPVCKEKMNEELNFCELCGASLENVQTDKQRRNNQQAPSQRTEPKKVKKFILSILIIVLLVASYTGYQLLEKKYSKEAVRAQFKTALSAKDMASLQELIQPDDSRMQINEDSLQALFALIDNEPSIVQEMTDQLDNYGYGTGLFTLAKEGKHYGIFDRYVISAEGYFLVLSNTSDEKTTFYLNDKEVGVLEAGEDYKEIGPLLAGSYLVKATSDENGEQGEDMITVKLTDEASKLDIAFDTEIFEYEEEEIEMISGFEENHDYYILPDSDAVYLEKSDLYNLTAAELRIARNEIFARYGYIFQSKELQDYFASLNWYQPNVNYDGYLSEVEKHNIELIKSLE